MAKVETASKLPTAPQPHKFNPVNSPNSDYAIKPCPFCGNKEVGLASESQGVHFEMGTGHFVRCNFLKGGCGARGGSRTNKEEAIEAWNARVTSMTHD